MFFRHHQCSSNAGSSCPFPCLLEDVFVYRMLLNLAIKSSTFLKLVLMISPSFVNLTSLGFHNNTTSYFPPLEKKILSIYIFSYLWQSQIQDFSWKSSISVSFSYVFLNSFYLPSSPWTQCVLGWDMNIPIFQIPS